MRKKSPLENSPHMPKEGVGGRSSAFSSFFSDHSASPNRASQSTQSLDQLPDTLEQLRRHCELPPRDRHAASYALAPLVGWGLLDPQGLLRRVQKGTPIVVWVVGASRLVEAVIAEEGYFSFAAGPWKALEIRVECVLIGDDLNQSFPADEKTKVRASSPSEGTCTLPAPDIVACLHPNEDALSSLLTPSLVGGRSPEACIAAAACNAPLLLTGRCREIAMAWHDALANIDADVSIGRNPFSALAGNTVAEFDANGWLLLVRKAGGQQAGDAVMSSARRWRRHMTTVCHLRSTCGVEDAATAETLGDGDVPEQDEAAGDATGNVMYWGILDIKFDPSLPLSEQVRVLEMGDGRISRFSGCGAAIVERFHETSNNSSCRDLSRRKPALENKKLTNDLFAACGYSHVVPRQACRLREFSKGMGREICSELQVGQNDCVVLKLCNRSRGAGVIIIKAGMLEETLGWLLKLPNDMEEWLDKQVSLLSASAEPVWLSLSESEEHLRHWWSNECPCFIVERYYSSTSLPHNGQYFDATLRVGFALRQSQDNHSVGQSPSGPSVSSSQPVIQWLGGYWKLPKTDLSSEDIQSRTVSKAGVSGTAEVEQEHLHEVYTLLGDSVPRVFKRMMEQFASGEQVAQNCASIPLMGAFVITRLQRALVHLRLDKARWVTYVQNVLSRNSGFPQKVVSSYMSRGEGMEAAMNNCWDRVEEPIRRALEEHPANATARHYLGMALLERGDVAGAVLELQLSLLLDPDWKASYVNLAVAAIRAGDWKLAEQACQAGLARHPRTLACSYNLAVSLYQQASRSVQTLDSDTHADLKGRALRALEIARGRKPLSQGGYFADRRGRRWMDIDEQMLQALKETGDNDLPILPATSGWRLDSWRP